MHLKELCHLLTSSSRPIQSLNMSGNMVTDSGLLTLCGALQATQIEVVLLSRNRITEKGVE